MGGENISYILLSFLVKTFYTFKVGILIDLIYFLDKRIRTDRIANQFYLCPIICCVDAVYYNRDDSICHNMHTECGNNNQVSGSYDPMYLYSYPCTVILCGETNL